MTLAPNRRPPSSGNKTICMNKTLSVLFWVIFCITGLAAQQPYASHTVEAGETIYSISRAYKIDINSLYRLNPDAQEGLAVGQVLVVPVGPQVQEQEVEFKKHRVKRRETLKQIAQKYGVTEEDIKKYNKQLYSKAPKKGEKLRIPIFPKQQDGGVAEEVTDPTKQLHRVQAKETKYGIARMYGISIAELEALNPNVPENLPIGTDLVVPLTPAVVPTATIDTTAYDFYEVQPKEGFFRLKVKLGLSQEELVALNPYAADGLKEGMVLKIPKSLEEGSENGVPIIDLEDQITDRSNKKLAVLLPFSLNWVTDSIEANEQLLRDNRTLRIALDFYSGVLMAAEFAKDKGITVQMDVYDTEGSTTKLDAVLGQNDFSDTDAVIGPLLSKNVSFAANRLKRDDVPVFSPLSNRNIKLTANLFQTMPDNELLAQTMIDYLERNAQGKNLILIADPDKAARKAALVEAIPGLQLLAPREEGFLYVVDIQDRLVENQENWFVLESDDPIIISNVVGLLNGMPEEYSIRLFTTDKNRGFEYDDVSNFHLANLDFTFPSISRSYRFDDKDAFLVSYQNKYEVLPNKYAVRGFDVTYDVLLRLASEGDVYDGTSSQFETSYIESNFRYSKKLFSGYRNLAHFILKYNENLELEVVER